MFRYAKNVRLVSFLQQAFQMALTGFLPVSLWLSMALCDSHSGSHWLSLPLSGILWPPLAHYCFLISRIQPLISSQGLARLSSPMPRWRTLNRSGSQSGFAYLRAFDLRAHLKTHAWEKSHICEFTSIRWFEELLWIKGYVCTICFCLRNNGKLWGFET